jgi:hypothetical protein
MRDKETSEVVLGERKSGRRHLTGLLLWIVRILAIGAPAVVLLYQLHIFQR